MRTQPLLLVALFSLAGACAVDDPSDSSSTTTDEVGGASHFELWQDSGSQFYFHLKAGNGQVLVTSEGYTDRTAALGGVLSVLDNGETGSRYEQLVATNGQHYFVLLAANSKVLATSETYSSSTASKAGATATRTAVGAYLEPWTATTGARFDVFYSEGFYYFDLHAANGEIVLQSQRYDSNASALNGAFSVEDNGVTAARYDIAPTPNGGYYWNLVASNGQVIGSSEVYASLYDAQRGRDAVIALLPQIHLL